MVTVRVTGKLPASSLARVLLRQARAEPLAGSLSVPAKRGRVHLTPLVPAPVSTSQQVEPEQNTEMLRADSSHGESCAKETE
jgi:hypothetical protein